MDYPTYEVARKVGSSETMKVEHEKAMERAREGKGEQPVTPAKMRKQGINVFIGSLWTCADIKGELKPVDYEEIYIHSKVALVDDAAFTIGSANLNLRSMALDSELNVLSQAQDVAYQLREDLFSQCTGNVGPAQFANMEKTFKEWQEMASSNFDLKTSGIKLASQLLPFNVDRKPGSPVV
jgi:phosphatidylserine/phosphatidylglycerophosphate/cardiolipin synthase-like enzyme